jgi:hypothetical protein
MPLTIKNWFTGLWTLTTESNRFGSYRLGWIYLILLPFSIPSLFFLQEPRQRISYRWLVLISVIFYTAWFFQTHQTRFLIPTTSIFSILASGGIYWFSRIRKGIWFSLVRISVLILVVTTHWLFSNETKNRLLEVATFLLERSEPEDYYESHLPGYGVFRYANTHLVSSDYVLFDLWENRGYLLDNRYSWINPINQRDIKLETYTDSHSLAKDIKQRGYTHFISSEIFGNAFLDIKYGHQIDELIDEFIAQYGFPEYQTEVMSLYVLHFE